MGKLHADVREYKVNEHTIRALAIGNVPCDPSP